MSKKKTLFTVGLLVLLLTVLISSTALACGSFNKMRAQCVNYYNPIMDLGQSRVDRCSCTPVDNYLYASAKVQYDDGGTVITKPVVIVSGFDRTAADAQSRSYSMICNTYVMKAQCYTGPGSMVTNSGTVPMGYYVQWP